MNAKRLSTALVIREQPINITYFILIMDVKSLIMRVIITLIINYKYSDEHKKTSLTVKDFPVKLTPSICTYFTAFEVNHN